MEKRRPFADTQAFLQTAYDSTYVGETRVSKDQLNQEEPYSWVLTDGEIQYFQAQFRTKSTKTRDVFPLTQLGIDERPSRETSIGKRRANDTLLYVFDPDLSSQQIAQMSGVTKQDINQGRATYLKDISENIPFSLQQRYPFPELNVKKPLSVAHRMSFSRIHGGSAIDIGHEVQNGVSTEDLVKKYGRAKVYAARRQLLRWGLEAPKKLRELDPATIAARISDPQTPLEELRRLITLCNNPGTVRKFLNAENPVLLRLAEVQQEAWGNKNGRKIRHAYDMMIRAGEPVNAIESRLVKNGKTYLVHTYFLITRRRNEAVAVLSEADDTHKRQTVCHAFGPEPEEAPTSYQLAGLRRESHVNLRKLFGQTINFTHLPDDLREKLSTSPVPIHIYLNGLYVSANDAELLVRYVSGKIE